MSRRYGTPLNAYVATADPATPTIRTGDIYYNSSANELRYYNGSVWRAVMSLAGNQTAPGTKTFSTIQASAIFEPNGLGPNLALGSSTLAVNANTNTNTVLTLAGLTTQSGDLISFMKDVAVVAKVDANGSMTAPSYAASGLTGSTAASRYVGATASGAPASGAHLLGDWVISQTGTIYICTVAGTPGTWTGITGGAPSNMVTTDTTQTITAQKRFSSASGYNFSASSAGAGVLNVEPQASVQPGISVTAATSQSGNLIEWRAPGGSPVYGFVAATGGITVPTIALSGLTGATATNRRVGATASGAPTSGTFVSGDWVTDLTGRTFVCTVGGSPGTWVSSAGRADMQSSSPSSPVTGQLWVDTDDNQIYAWSGSAWTVVGSPAPPSTIWPFAGGTIPTGWLLCDGSPVSRTTYATLYAALGGASSPYGQGDGSTTFNVPDLRGRALIGVGTGTGLTIRSRGTQYGAEDTPVVTHGHAHTHGTNTQDDTPDHGHSTVVGNDAPDHAHTYNASNISWAGTGSGSVTRLAAQGTLSTTNGANARHSHSVTVNGATARHHHPITSDSTSAGVSGTGTNLQPSLAVNYMIKT